MFDFCLLFVAKRHIKTLLSSKKVKRAIARLEEAYQKPLRAIDSEGQIYFCYKPLCLAFFVEIFPPMFFRVVLEFEKIITISPKNRCPLTLELILFSIIYEGRLINVTINEHNEVNLVKLAAKFGKRLKVKNFKELRVYKFLSSVKNDENLMGHPVLAIVLVSMYSGRFKDFAVKSTSKFGLNQLVSEELLFQREQARF